MISYNADAVKWVSNILNVATFECLLDKYSNGSTVIVLRSFLTSVAIYAATLGLRNLIDPTKTWAFSTFELRRQIIETGAWFGLLIGATYASFYARFSSQWAYLANLYCKIKELEAEESDAYRIAELKAAFIEDAEELHLVRKAIFAALPQF